MSSRQKKITATTVAVILVLALGLAGTFAASSSTDSDGGFGEDVTTSLFLHDDFSTDWTGDVRDRDVYVENNGDTALYVRMRLDEFMRYGGKSIVKGGKEEDKTTWRPHRPIGTDVTQCDTEIHDYFTIQMGNETGLKYKPGTKNAYNPLLTDADKTATTSAAKVVTMKEYLKAETKPEPCWVLDETDGYAYWYTHLQKGKTTGALLNSITNTGLVDESYYYGMNAKAEAVTESDLFAWLNGNTVKDSATGEKFDQASTNAVRFLKNLSPKYIEITQEMKDNGAADFDSDNDGYLTKQENAEYEAEKGVTDTPVAELTAQEKVAAANVGDVVNLKNNAANHPYGAATDWIILSKTDTEAALITKDMVTSRQYHPSDPYPTWPKSDIRGWLNSSAVDGGTDYTGNGYIETLGTDLKKVIKEESLQTANAFDDWNTMDTTSDKVYLLTETWQNSEIVGVNPNQNESLSLMTKEQMKCSSTAADGKSATYWWLRSPYSYEDPSAGNRVAIIHFTSAGRGAAGVGNEYGVRPCVTVKLK